MGWNEREGRRREGRRHGREETGGTATDAKASVEQYNQEMGGKGDMGEREMDNMLLGDTTAGQNATSYSEVVIEG